MKKQFSKEWNSSKKPSKQRKFRFKAPLHIKGKFLNARLSKELMMKYKKRSIRVRTGDKVRIMRGQFKKQEGKVEEVDIKKSLIYIAKIEHIKRDGTKARYPIHPSNVMIIELNTEDKKRFKERKQSSKKSKKVSAEKVSEKFSDNMDKNNMENVSVKKTQKVSKKTDVEKK